MKPERNDPCPCGSGKKHKKCCWRAKRPDISTTILIEAESVSRRDCGSCTACCDGWVRMNIYGHEVHPGRPCPYSTGQSCSIYERRPEHPCRKFVCGWLEQNSPLPDEYRPDKIGVIFVIMDWHGLPIYALTPAGHDPGGEILEWVEKWSRKHQQPFIYQMHDEWYAFGPTAFQKEILEKLARGEKLW